MVTFVMAINFTRVEK